MLLQKDGKVFNPKHLPSGRAAREAVLATLREVRAPVRDRSKWFQIGERARLVG